MESIQRAKPNTLLRRQRLLRGWSLQQVVDRLCELCAEENDVPGVTADMVSKWERGERKPSRFYQGKLCLLYGTSADHLGLIELDNTSEPPHTNDTHSTLSHLTSFSHAPAITSTNDAVLDREAEASEILATHLLSESGKQLATLIAMGWTQQDIINALHLVLQGETAMAKLLRRQVLQLGAGMLLLGGINFPTHEHPSVEEQTQLAQALEESIVGGWALFHTAGTAQVLAVSQSQLTLVQQAHTLLSPGTLPFLYAGAYRLRGAALYFQGRYPEALHAHERAYLAAAQTGHTWDMAESLSWQAYVHQECGQPAEAIQTIEEALRLIGNPSDEALLRLKAHLLTCWAENATQMHEKKIAKRKLETAAALLENLSPNEEFDRTKWLQQAGNCAVTEGDYETASRHFEDALSALPPHWTLRHAITLVPLAVAYARRRERDASLAVAEKALPVLKAMNAPIMNRQFITYIQQDLLDAYPGDPLVSKFVTRAQQQFPQLH